MKKSLKSILSNGALGIGFYVSISGYKDPRGDNSGLIGIIYINERIIPLVRSESMEITVKEDKELIHLWRHSYTSTNQFMVINYNEYTLIAVRGMLFHGEALLGYTNLKSFWILNYLRDIIPEKFMRQFSGTCSDLCIPIFYSIEETHLPLVHLDLMKSNKGGPLSGYQLYSRACAIEKIVEGLLPLKALNNLDKKIA